MNRRYCQDYTYLAEKIAAQEAAKIEENFQQAAMAVPFLVFITTILVCIFLDA